MYRVLLGVAVTALIASCGESSTEATKRLVGRRLKDPGSAIYADIRWNHQQTNPIACGTVNAKNSFGAYEGATEFIEYHGLVRFAKEDDPVTLNACCDVLMSFDPDTVKNIDDTPGYRRTCARLDLMNTLQ
jgi:hypothetical protein